MDSLDFRILVVAPTGRDADLMTKVLGEGGFASRGYASIAEAAQEVERGAAALLLAEEALGPAELAELDRCLERQPEWSDLPVLILVAGGRETMESEARARDRSKLQHKNVTLLERPIRIATLMSAVDVALRSRRRQYEIRSNLEQRATAQEAVRRSEKLAVAGRLAASIAHEINNPLESVTNLLYLISSSNNVDEIKVFARTAEQELARVSEITTQTLRFHRQQSNAVDTSVEDLMDSVLSAVSRAPAGLADPGGICLSCGGEGKHLRGRDPAGAGEPGSECAGCDASRRLAAASDCAGEQAWAAGYAGRTHRGGGLGGRDSGTDPEHFV